MLDYNKDIEIDETALDVEWLNQTSLSYKYIKQAVFLRKKERLADEKRKIIEAELIQEVNLNPKKTTNKEKPNASDIEAYYRSHERYKTARKEWIDSVEEADFAELMQREISLGRRAALENLVRLHGQEYFSSPSFPRDLTEEKQKRADAKISEAMKRSKSIKEGGAINE